MTFENELFTDEFSSLNVFHVIHPIVASFVTLQLYRAWLPTSELAKYNWALASGSVANGIAITVLNNVYSAVALKLTEWENHETDSSYQFSLILKTFSFQFVNSFLTLFYTAFVTRDMIDLSERLLAILVSKQHFRTTYDTGQTTTNF